MKLLFTFLMYLILKKVMQ